MRTLWQKVLAEGKAALGLQQMNAMAKEGAASLDSIMQVIQPLPADNETKILPILEDEGVMAKLTDMASKGFAFVLEELQRAKDHDCDGVDGLAGLETSFGVVKGLLEKVDGRFTMEVVVEWLQGLWPESLEDKVDLLAKGLAEKILHRLRTTSA